MATIRVLRTQKAILTKTFYPDSSETGIDATGAVSVAVTRLDGTTVESGNASGPDANHVYSYAYGGSDTLDEVVATWTETIAGDAIVLDQDHIQICGGFFWSLADGRAVDKALANATTYPVAELVARRIEVEDECERICDQFFVPRFKRLVLDGTGTMALNTGCPWIRTVRSVAVAPRFGQAYVPFTTQQLAAVAPSDYGVLRVDGGLWGLGGGWGPGGWQGVGPIWFPGRRNVIVELECGMDYPPAEIARASKIRFKSLLLQKNSPLPDRADRIAVTEMGTVMLATPGRDHTGIPEVDAAYARWPSPTPGFG